MKPVQTTTSFKKKKDGLLMQNIMWELKLEQANLMYFPVDIFMEVTTV